MSEPHVIAPWPEYLKQCGFQAFPGDHERFAEVRSEHEQIRAAQRAARSAWLYFDLYQQTTGEYLEYACGRPLNNPITGGTV